MLQTLLHRILLALLQSLTACVIPTGLGLASVVSYQLATGVMDASSTTRSMLQSTPRFTALCGTIKLALYETTEIAGQDGADDGADHGDCIRWKEHIAMHAQCDKIIGTGIIAAHLERIHHTLDANRGNKARVDYVFYRADNTFCRVHPGT